MTPPPGKCGRSSRRSWKSSSRRRSKQAARVAVYLTGLGKRFTSRATMNPVWQQLARRAEMELSQQQLDRLNTYIHLLLAANREMNLTRIDTIESAEVGHVGDALTVLPHLPKASFTMADVGSGGGVPGI